MRVTNAMISNNMMLGLNKNMNRLNTLYDQVTTLKKIQRPSDDPIILGRSLKLRLNVLETAQYKTNVAEAKSWMEVSADSIKNTHRIYDNIRKEYVQAANGPLGVDDREKIMEAVKQLKNQLIQEANANYAGRNVFSGYKTDQKVLFDKDQTGTRRFEKEIGQNDIETVTYRDQDYSRIRLPYGDIDGNIDIDGMTVIGIDSTDVHPDAINGGSYYKPGPDDVYFMKDTGELILGENAAKNMAGMKVTYEKTNFKAGDPNPDIFFNVNDPGDPADPTKPVIYGDAKDPQRIEYELGIGTKMDINVLGKNLFDPLSLRDIDEMIHILENYEEGSGVDLSELFTGAIGKMDKALSTVSTQQADLSTRMERLDLTKERLGDDEITYKELLSRTEDVELDRAYMEFNVQYAIYQSALQVTAKVVQPTLMDFLR